MRILHIFRAPVGGLFRHVCDLAAEQSIRGHEVGVVYDSTSGDGLSANRLRRLASACRLGLHPVPMSRTLSLRDVLGILSVRRLVRRLGVDILHGHGAKGGALARLAMTGRGNQSRRPLRFYTPHGGSLHYDRSSIAGRAYLGLERFLEHATDGLIFECAYASRTYAAKVGAPRTSVRIVPNGLDVAEFTPIAPSAAATDLLYVGELRHLKGVDVLLEAIARLPPQITATFVGSGPDASALQALAHALGLEARVRFRAPMPARQAFALGHLLVVPSRAESFPYIVLEAAAAGVPLLATAVGGIPEIVAGTDAELVPPADAACLAAAIGNALAERERTHATARQLRAAVEQRFTIPRMVDGVLAFYASPGEPLAALGRSQPATH